MSPDKFRPTTALVRAVPDALVGCELTWIDRRPIDVDAARASHRAYRAALQDAGLRVVVAPAAEAHPDCPFVEDLLMEVAGVRILTHPGSPARRGERAGVLDALAGVRGSEPIVMPSSVRLDGGDVLQVGGVLYVGNSTRTDAGAVAWLRTVVESPVVEVPLGGGRLHLKTAATALDDRTLLAGAFADVLRRVTGLEVLASPRGEEEAANVLRLPDGTVLVADGFPQTVELLGSRGISARVLDIEPFARAEAGLTCLSVLLTEPEET